MFTDHIYTFIHTKNKKMSFGIIPTDVVGIIMKLVIVDIDIDYFIQLCQISKTIYGTIHTLKFFVSGYFCCSDCKGNWSMTTNYENNKNKMSGCEIYMKNYPNNDLKDTLYYWTLENISMEKDVAHTISKKYNIESVIDLYFKRYPVAIDYTLLVNAKYKVDIEKYKHWFDLGCGTKKINFKSVGMIKKVYMHLSSVYGNGRNNGKSDGTETSPFNFKCEKPYIPKGIINGNFYDDIQKEYVDELYNYVKRFPCYEP